MIGAHTEPYSHFSYVRDAVDDILEKALKNGGDVEFAEEPVLDRFRHIAMTKYYK